MSTPLTDPQRLGFAAQHLAKAQSLEDYSAVVRVLERLSEGETRDRRVRRLASLLLNEAWPAYALHAELIADPEGFNLDGHGSVLE